MLTLEQILEIKHMHENEGLSLREISKVKGYNFRTVEKYAHNTNWNQKVTVIHEHKHHVLDQYTKYLDEWILNDINEPRKQNHTARRMYERLTEEHGYEGSYESVALYVRKSKLPRKLRRPGHIPIAHSLGESEVDFGDFKYYDGNGASHKGHALVLSFSNSNCGWVQAFKSENQECLFEGLKTIFKYINGVPPMQIFDNMSTAVVHVGKGRERTLSEGFIRFQLQYGFQSHFCMPGEPQEKGNVENKVGTTRRNLLVPVPTITNFDDFNAKLLSDCDKLNKRIHYIKEKPLCDLWPDDEKCLLKLPDTELEVFRYESRSVNLVGKVSIDTNTYSVSPELSCQIVQAKIFYNKIEFYYKGQLVSKHERSYLRNEEVLEWTDYLKTLAKKPGAVPNTRFYGQIPLAWRNYIEESPNSERKEVIKILIDIVKDDNLALAEKAINLAFQSGKMNSAGIRQSYDKLSKDEVHKDALDNSSAETMLRQPETSAFDLLTRGLKNNDEQHRNENEGA